MVRYSQQYRYSEAAGEIQNDKASALFSFVWIACSYPRNVLLRRSQYHPDSNERLEEKQSSAILQLFHLRSEILETSTAIHIGSAGTEDIFNDHGGEIGHSCDVGTAEV